MRKSGFVLTVIVCLATIAVAQERGMDNAAGENTKKSNPELRTVIGCLSRTANTYVITGGAPGPKQFRIIGGDTKALKGEIGHTVSVVGMVSTNDAEENMITPYNEGSTTGVAYNTIVARKIKKVYGNCSEAGKEYPGDHQ
jgi:hypothetical protein